MCHTRLLVLLAVLWSHAVYAGSATEPLTQKENARISQQYKLASAFNPGQPHDLQYVDASTFIRASRNSSETVSLQLLGTRVDVSFVRTETHPLEGVIHWIGTIDGAADSYVRITIDSSSLFGSSTDSLTSSRVAGIILLEGNTYALRPVGESGAHVVYQLKDVAAKGLRLDVGGEAEQKARFLEALGRRHDLLQSRPKDSYSIGRGGAATTISEMSADITRHFTFESEADLPELLELISPYVPLIGAESFEFKEIMGGQTDRTYDFTQYIDGIRVVGANLRIFVDKATNEVTDIIGPLEPDLGFNKIPKISSADALQKALEWANSNLSHRVWQPSKFDASLVFLRNSVEWKSPVSIAWEIVVIDGEGGAEILFVHGENGAVRREAIVIADQVQICDADEGGFQKFCHLRTPVWDEDGTCLQPAKCNLSKFKVPNDVTRENIDMWKDLIDTFCCLSVGIGGRLDVMVNSDIETVFGSPPLADGVYAAGTFDAGFQLIPYETIGIDKDSGVEDDPDLMGHEMGHALHHARSPMTFSLGTGGTLSTNRETRAVKEGIADVNAIIHENYKHNPKFSNPNWETSGRNLSVEKIFPDDISAGQSDWENGRILGYAFHELVTRNNNVDFDSAARIFLGSIKKLADSDSNHGLSFDEVRQAMIKAATTQIQKNAVNDAFAAAGVVFTEDGAGGGGGTAPPSGGAGTPSAPGFVNGSVQIPCLNGVSIHENTWGSSASATQYDVWYSLDSIIYQYSFTSSGTSALTQNTVDVDVKVDACNVSGCSVLSLDSYSQQFLCGF